MQNATTTRNYLTLNLQQHQPTTHRFLYSNLLPSLPLPLQGYLSNEAFKTTLDISGYPGVSNGHNRIAGCCYLPQYEASAMPE